MNIRYLWSFSGVCYVIILALMVVECIELNRAQHNLDRAIEALDVVAARVATLEAHVAAADAALKTPTPTPPATSPVIDVSTTPTPPATPARVNYAPDRWTESAVNNDPFVQGYLRKVHYSMSTMAPWSRLRMMLTPRMEDLQFDAKLFELVPGSGERSADMGVLTVPDMLKRADAVHPQWGVFAKALCTIESSCRLNPPDGDNGQSIGPFQIQRAYWLDAIRNWHELAEYDYEMCRYPWYAQAVVLSYAAKWSPQELKNGNWEVIARRHNGGPLGDTNPRTLPYWQNHAFDRLRAITTK
jgi:hypothetical protein